MFSMLSCIAPTATLIMFLSALTIAPKAQARDMATISTEEAKCFTLMANEPGGKAYCTSLLKTLLSSSSSNGTGQHGPALDQCWSSLRSIQGCVSGIFFSMLSGDFSRLQHDCCQAIESITAECLLKMFPLNPLFPTSLLNFCKNI